MNGKELAMSIVESNKYLTLATVGEKGSPWAAPIFYCLDRKTLNFYFISQLDSLHVKHLLKNPKVALAIFDSHASEGQGVGVQISGKARMMKDSELDEAFKYYHTTFIPMKKESFTGKAPYRFFKLIPEQIWVTDPEAKVDRRVEVKINTLI